MTKNRRGSRWVDSRIQGALIGHALFHWAFFLIAAFAATSGIEQISAVLASEPENARAISLSKFWERCQPLAIVLLVFLPIFCLDLLRWSHRFVGPMVKIRRAVRELASGESIGPIRLREGDYWTDLADDLNLVQQRIASAEMQRSSEQAKDQEDQIREEVAKLEAVFATPAANVQPTVS